MRKPGRPKASKLSRVEQLRQAKRKQRARQQAAGLVNVQFPASRQLAQKIAMARRAGALERILDDALNREVIRLRDYPQLADVAWNRSEEFILAKEAFQLYERNWGFIDLARLSEREAQLIDELKNEFGAGVINA